jgi:hypothetical protein
MDGVGGSFFSRRDFLALVSGCAFFSGFPHWMQNCAPGLFSRPHFWQNKLLDNGWPHWMQNAAPCLFSLPHCLQIIITP